MLLQVGSLLHDIGHGPLSHTFETIYKHYVKEKDHMALGQEIILGNINITEEEDGAGYRRFWRATTTNLLQKDVARLLRGDHEKKYLGQMLHGDVDVDR